MGQFYHQNPSISSSQVWHRLTIWGLIVSWHDWQVHCALLATRPLPAVGVAIRSTFVQSLSKQREFRIQSHVTSQRFNEYWFDRTSVSGRSKSGLKLPNLDSDHIMIRSELRYFIEVKGAVSAKWNQCLGPLWLKTHGFMSRLGDHHAMTMWVRFSDRSGTAWKNSSCPNPDCWRVSRTRN